MLSFRCMEFHQLLRRSQGWSTTNLSDWVISCSIYGTTVCRHRIKKIRFSSLRPFLDGLLLLLFLFNNPEVSFGFQNTIDPTVFAVILSITTAISSVFNNVGTTTFSTFVSYCFLYHTSYNTVSLNLLPLPNLPWNRARKLCLLRNGGLGQNVYSRFGYFCSDSLDFARYDSRIHCSKTASGSSTTSRFNTKLVVPVFCLIRLKPCS